MKLKIKRDKSPTLTFIGGLVVGILIGVAIHTVWIAQLMNI